MRHSPLGDRERTSHFLAAAVAALAVCSAPVLGHEDAHTHMGLATVSLGLAGDPFSQEARQAILNASRDEDHLTDCSGINPFEDSFYCHFYNPITNEGLNEDFHTSARERAADLWAQALTAYAQDPANVGESGPYFLLGRVLHLLQDMASPAHIHDDAHVGGFGDPDKCPGLAVAGDADDFENWGWCPGFGSTHIDDYVTGVTLAGDPTESFSERIQAYFQGMPKVSAVADGEGFIREVADRAYDLTTFHGVLKTQDPQPGVSELQRMFPDVVYGSFDWQFEIPNIGDWDVSPRPSPS